MSFNGKEGIIAGHQVFVHFEGISTVRAKGILGKRCLRVDTIPEETGSISEAVTSVERASFPFLLSGNRKLRQPGREEWCSTTPCCLRSLFSVPFFRFFFFLFFFLFKVFVLSSLLHRYDLLNILSHYIVFLSLRDSSSSKCK